MCPFCNSSYIKKIIKGPSWSIFSCLDCTNAWTSPPPSNIDYEENNFHKKTSATSMDDLYPLWKKSIEMQIRLLTKHLKPNASILEIGCGQGMLMKKLENLKFDVYGIEPSAEASQIARKHGLNVVTGYFPNQSLPLNKKYDAVIMSHTLEHVKDPGSLINEIKKIIPGGILMLVQTNWKGLMPKIYKSKWYAWAPEHHYWHFTPKGLSIYLNKFNFKIIEFEYSSLVHPKNIIWRISNLKPKFKDQFHLIAKL